MKVPPLFPLPLLVAVLAFPAAASPRSQLLICTDEPGGPEILQRLDGWMSTARVLGDGMEACSEARPGYRGVFLPKGRTVVFLLRNEAGGTLEQTIPWLGSTAAPLAAVEQQGKLPQLSLLLEALLAEERLGLATPPPEEEVRPRAEAPVPAPKKRRPPPPSLRRWAPQAQVEEIPREVPSPPAQVEVPQELPSPPAQEEEDPQEPLPSQGPEGESTTEEQAQEGPWEEPGEAALEAPLPIVPAPIFGTPTRRPWQRDAAVEAGTRFRTPYFIAADLGLSASWGPLYAQADLQLPAIWRLEDRPLRVTGLGGGAGVQHPVALGASEVRLRAGVSLEWLEVERLDLPWAAPHRHWDFGVGLGLEWRVRLFGTWTGLTVEGGGMPTARTIRLPEGPQADLGRAWARLALRLGWDL